MVEVLHEIAPAIRPGVVAAFGRALRSGGWLVIVDETYPTTLAEARLLRGAGFAGTIERSTFGEGFTLLTTQR